jgi:hypothetical protein
MMWAALYQQRPAPEEGDYFKADWLKNYETTPARETLRVYGASDYAVTADGGDYTCHIVTGLDPEGRMYILDLWRQQASSDAWIEAFCDLVKLWKPMTWAEEQGQITAGVGPFLDRRQREDRNHAASDLSLIDLRQHATGNVLLVPPSVHQNALGAWLRTGTKVIYIPIPALLSYRLAPSVLSRAEQVISDTQVCTEARDAYACTNAIIFASAG